MIISLPIPRPLIPHCFGWEGPSCSVCINSVRLRLGPPGRAGLIGEKAWEQIGPEKAHNIHILTNIWDHCWGWKWGTCDWSWPHVAEVTVALEMWQQRKSGKQKTERDMKYPRRHCFMYISSDVSFSLDLHTPLQHLSIKVNELKIRVLSISLPLYKFRSSQTPGVNGWLSVLWLEFEWVVQKARVPFQTRTSLCLSSKLSHCSDNVPTPDPVFPPCFLKSEYNAYHITED